MSTEVEIPSFGTYHCDLEREAALRWADPKQRKIQIKFPSFINKFKEALQIRKFNNFEIIVVNIFISFIEKLLVIKNLQNSILQYFVRSG